MPSKRFDEARPFLALAVVAGLWIVTPLAVRKFSRVTFFEFQAPVAVAVSYGRDLQEYWGYRLHSPDELIAAGRDLARAYAAYADAAEENATLRAELARLEELLRLPAFDDFRRETARVVRRDFSGWWQRLVIRKGSNFGITVGSPVIFAGGVVGRVTEVYASTAVVELISSPNVRLAATVEGDTRPISFQGGVNPTFGPARGIVEFVPLEVFASPQFPRRLVTSGLGVFPPGLALGQIVRVELGPDGLFKTGEVELDPRLSTLAEVTVLVPIPTS